MLKIGITGGIGGLIGIPPVNIGGMEIYKPSEFVFLTVGTLLIVLFAVNRLVH